MTTKQKNQDDKSTEEEDLQNLHIIN